MLLKLRLMHINIQINTVWRRRWRSAPMFGC